MPKRTDLKKILIIGSGPIVVGQAAEFDYAGTQACIALREEGYDVVLLNSNPATIMTDAAIAGKVYMEPLTLEYAAEVLRRERPDALLPGIGGQTGLNLAVRLEREGVLRECGTELIGTGIRTIELAEDRERFKELCLSLGEPVIPSSPAYSLEEALAAADALGYPVVLRPAFTLGGTGGGFAENSAELEALCRRALALSPIGQVLIEKSVKGYKEIEFELMRDSSGRVITVCGMENVDPVGVHTGDSIVVAPIMTLSEHDARMLNESAIKIIRALGIQGGCNIQFALSPDSSEYYLIEVNPRVSRSSALASKASGYPIARVTAKVAVGMTLDEIKLANATAAVEPSLDYAVVKLPRFAFDKFPSADEPLGTQMMATGEVMGIGASLEEALLKAVRSLELGVGGLRVAKFDNMSEKELFGYISAFRADGIFAIAQLLRLGADIGAVRRVSMIDRYFLEAVARIVGFEKELAAHPWDADTLRRAKELGFGDGAVARLWGADEARVYEFRRAAGLFPAFRMVDTFHTGAHIPYYYSSFSGPSQSLRSGRRKLIVLGAGPIRIGQGIEFDYSAVHAVMTLRREGCEAIIINNNPETVSTDYSVADKLYFEPLTAEDVMNVIELERPDGVIVSLGGQTAVNLAEPLAERGVRIIGTGRAAIERAENRACFDALLSELGIPRPRGLAAASPEEGLRAAEELGYPVLVRPSFALGGTAVRLVGDERALRRCFAAAFAAGGGRPVLIDKYIAGRELEVDAVCDGREVFVPGIMELIERAGVHSGDSMSVYPCATISEAVKSTILQYTERLALAVGIVGLCNIQFVVDNEERVYVIELNPRSSRTVPFLSKASDFSLADLATEVMLGRNLRELGVFDARPEAARLFSVKAPVFSFTKLRGLDPRLGPEMKSTGEAIGRAATLSGALYKAFLASGLAPRRSGPVLASVSDCEAREAVPLLRRLRELGFELCAVPGTARLLASAGIPARDCGACSQAAESIRMGQFACVAVLGSPASEDPSARGLCSAAAECGVPLLTCADTLRALLSALENAPADGRADILPPMT